MADDAAMKHEMRKYILPFILIGLLGLQSCATTPTAPACPDGRQNLTDCPPAEAVDDAFINTLFEERTWTPQKDLDVDPIEFGKFADIPIQEARARFLGPTDEAARDSLAAKIWMIENADHTIDFIYYIFKQDLIGYAFLAAMCDAVQRGVDVRVMVDALGSHHASHPELKALETCAENAGFMRNADGQLTTRKARVQVVIFNAVSKIFTNPNRRSHDKLLVKDGRFPEKSAVMTGGRNISKDYYGINEDGSAYPDSFRDAEILIRDILEEDDEIPTVGYVSEIYATVLLHFKNNKRIKPSLNDEAKAIYRREFDKSRDSLKRLKSFEIFRPHLDEIPQYMSTGFHDARVRLAHELGNLTDRKVTRDVAGNLERNPNSIMTLLGRISEERPNPDSARIVSPYLFLAEYRDEDGTLVKDEAEEMRNWLADHPGSTLEIITNSVLTSDNFPAQSVIDMDMAPRLLMSDQQREAWMAASGPDEAVSTFVSSEEWRELVNHPQLRVYETGRLDSVFLGNGTANYGKLHAKYYIEDEIGFVGTTNFDYRSRLYNNEMGFFFVSEGLAKELHEGIDALIESSYRWGSPEWFQLRKQVMGLKGMKGRSTRNQRKFYKLFKSTGFIWYL
jgi:phosphatidylserine/phosphatidylglycerophosphate/cardiolipin synthase-like enzyme